MNLKSLILVFITALFYNPCFTDSSDLSQGNFHYENAKSYISPICDKYPEMTGCTFWNYCKSNVGSDINKYCAPLEILTHICWDNVSVDHAVCEEVIQSSKYAHETNYDSLMEILPVTKQIVLNIGTICNIYSHDSDLCAQLKANNHSSPDLYLIYSQICISMPVPICHNYKLLCSKFSDFPFCSNNIKMRGSEVSTSCINTPNMDICTNYTYPYSESDINDLCNSTLQAPGCSIKKSCELIHSVEDICLPFSILIDICGENNSEMEKCNNYLSMCAHGTKVRDCSTPSLLDYLPSKLDLIKYIGSICNHMHTEACTESDPIDYLKKYSSLCLSMPEASDCKAWNKMCQVNSDLIQHAYCRTEENNHMVKMRMYFHNSLEDYILIKEWVPTTRIGYVFSWFAVVSLAITYEFIRFIRRKIENYWNLNSIEMSEPHILWKWGRNVSRAFLHTADVLVSLLLMLISMTFNIGLFLAILSGAFIGTLIFGKYLKSAEKKSFCH